MICGACRTKESATIAVNKVIMRSPSGLIEMANVFDRKTGEERNVPAERPLCDPCIKTLEANGYEQMIPDEKGELMSVRKRAEAPR